MVYPGRARDRAGPPAHGPHRGARLLGHPLPGRAARRGPRHRARALHGGRGRRTACSPASSTAPVLWGPDKARACASFARAREHRPRAQLRLRQRRRGHALPRGGRRAARAQPAARARARSRPSAAGRRYGSAAAGGPGVEPIVRTGAALAGLGTAAALGVGIGLLNRSRRHGANFATSVGSDARAGDRRRAARRDRRGEPLDARARRSSSSTTRARSTCSCIGALLRRDFTGVAKKEAARDPRFAPSACWSTWPTSTAATPRRPRRRWRRWSRSCATGISIAHRAGGHAQPDAAARPVQEGRLPHRDAGRRADRAGRDPQRRRPDVARRAVVHPGTIDVAVLAPIPTTGWRVGDLDRRVATSATLVASTLEHWPGERRPQRARSAAQRVATGRSR